MSAPGRRERFTWTPDMLGHVEGLLEPCERVPHAPHDLRIAYPQGVVNAAAALDSWAGFLRRTFRP